VFNNTHSVQRRY